MRNKVFFQISMKFLSREQLQNLKKSICIEYISKSRQMQNTNLKIDLPNIMINKNVCFHKFIFVSNS